MFISSEVFVLFCFASFFCFLFLCSRMLSYECWFYFCITSYLLLILITWHRSLPVFFPFFPPLPFCFFFPSGTFFFFLAFSVPVCETTGQQFPPGGRPRRRTFENVLPGDKKIVFLVLCARSQACFFGGAAVEEAAVRTLLHTCTSFARPFRSGC